MPRSMGPKVPNKFQSLSRSKMVLFYLISFGFHSLLIGLLSSSPKNILEPKKNDQISVETTSPEEGERNIMTDKGKGLEFDQDKVDKALRTAQAIAETKGADVDPDGAGRKAEYEDKIISGKLTNEGLYANYYPYVEVKERKKLEQYIGFHRRYFNNQFYPGGVYESGGGYTYAFKEDFALFSAAAPYYTREAQAVLDTVKRPAVDDIVTADAIAHSPWLSKLYNNRSLLLSEIGKSVKAPITKALDPKYFIADESGIPSIDLLKAYIFLSYFHSNADARKQLWQYIELDRCNDCLYAKSEVAGGISLSPNDLSLNLQISEGVPGDNNLANLKDRQEHNRSISFASFHLHAAEADIDNSAYSAPSIQDIHASTLNGRISGFVIAPIREKLFSVYYYRPIGETPPKGYVVNLGVFSAD